MLWLGLTVLVFIAFGRPSQSILSVGRFDLVAASAGSKIVFAGGTVDQFTGVTTVDIYDATLGQWTSSSSGAGSLSVGRFFLAVAAASNKIVFAGGYSGVFGSYNEVDIYDVSTGQWTSTSTGAGSLSAGRYGLAAGSAGNKIVFAGGLSVTPIAAVQVVVDIYDVTTGQWTSTSTGAGSLSAGRYGLAAGSAGNKIVFAGGFDGNVAVTTVDIYDVSTGQWNSTAGSLTVARYFLAAGSAGNKIVFAGGSTNSLTGLSSVDIFDVSTGYWTTSSLSEARWFLSAASLGSKIIFAGGSTISPTKVPTVDIFDASTGQWSASPGSMSVARTQFAGASVGNASVFAGGSNVTSVDLYDDLINIWNPTIAPPTTAPSPTTPSPPQSTSPFPSPPPTSVTATIQCPGTEPLAGAECVQGIWTIVGAIYAYNITMTAGQQLVITGTLTLAPVSNVTIVTPTTNFAPIRVSGATALAGSLTLHTIMASQDDIVVPLISVGSLSGSYSSIEVVREAHDLSCRRAKPQPTGTLYSVLLQVSPCTSRGKLSAGAIAGIVVGSLVLLGLIAVLVVKLLVHVGALKTTGGLLNAAEDYRQF